jgi:hypothetical protein
LDESFGKMLYFFAGKVWKAANLAYFCARFWSEVHFEVVKGLLCRGSLWVDFGFGIWLNSGN